MLITLPLATLMKQRQKFIEMPITNKGGLGEPAKAGSLQRPNQREKYFLTNLPPERAKDVTQSFISADLLDLMS